MKATKSKIIAATLVLFTACNNSGEQNGYNRWDQDRDQSLNQDEFNGYWSDENHQADWDQNQDGVVEKEEWNAAINEHYEGQFENGLFEETDANEDGFIDKNEMTVGTFSAWDANDDGKINQEEFKNHNYRN